MANKELQDHINTIARTIFDSWRRQHSESMLEKFEENIVNDQLYYQYQIHIGATDTNGLKDYNVDQLYFVVNCGVRFFWIKEPIHEFVYKEMSDATGDLVWGYSINNIKINEEVSLHLEQLG